MEQQSTYIIGLLIGGLVVGLFCGLAPLIAGFLKKRVTLGILGLFSCAVGGVILGLILALPVAIVFTLIISIKKQDEDFTSPPNPPNFNE